MPYKYKKDKARYSLLYMRKWRHDPRSRPIHLAITKCINKKRKESGKLKKYRLKLKINVINHYGGKCECCGEDKLEFLCIDHKNGGGNEHRRTTLKGRTCGHALYRWIIKNNYPDIFRILCANCNQAIGLHGYCPHKKIG